jgi:hypothetical protein
MSDIALPSGNIHKVPPKISNDSEMYIGIANFAGGGYIIVGCYDDEKEVQRCCQLFADDYDERVRRIAITNPKNPPPKLTDFKIYVCPNRNRPFDMWDMVFGG